MKYGKLNLGQIEALLNKIGGIEGMRLILSGRVGIVPLKPWQTVQLGNRVVELVRLKVGDLCGGDTQFTEDIYKTAKEVGLDFCPDETANQVLLQCKDLGNIEGGLQFATNPELMDGFRIREHEGKPYVTRFSNNAQHPRCRYEEFVFVIRK